MTKEGRSLRGLISSETGFPIAGALVRAYDLRGCTAGEGITDEGGRFSLDGLEAVSHLLLVEAKGFIPVWWSAIPGEDPVFLGLKPIRETTPHLTGIVAAASSGTPIAGAVLALHSDGGPPLGRAKTAGDGRFSFPGLPAGNYLLTAFAEGFGHLRRAIAVAEGESPYVLMTLPAGPARLRGLVREAGREAPIPGATISVREEGGDTLLVLQADAEGRFALDGLAPGTYTVMGWARGYSPAAAGVTLGPGDEAQSELRLPPAAGTIAGGVVRATDGTPLAGASVRLHDSFGLFLVAVRTDDGGHYRLADLAEGTHHLAVAAEGHRRAQVGVMVATGAEISATVALMAGAGAIAGRVIAAATGEPVRGARIRLLNQDGLVLEERSVRTDGGFDFAGLAAGHYNLVARGWGYGATWTGAVVVAGAVTRAELRLEEKRGGFAARILLPDGRPAPAAFSVYTRKGLAVLAGFTAADGSLDCGGLRPGEYVLLARGSGPAAGVREFFVAAGETTRFELGLAEAAAALTGRLLAAGRPVPGAVVRIFDEGGRPLDLTLSDREGRYLLPRLPGGKAILVASGPGLVGRAMPVEMHPGERTRLDLELETRPCNILKRILDTRGDPVADAELRVVEISSGRPLFTLVTNDEGFFWLRAWSPSAPSPPWIWL